MESLSELEEMQHVLHFLDTSLITSPSGSDLAAQKKRNESQRHRREYQQHHTPPDQLRDMAKLPENEERSSCNEIGEVIELLGSLEANDTPNQEMQHQKQQHEHQEALCGGNISCGLSRSTAFSDGVSQMAQPPQSAIPSYNQSVAENISPAGLLNGSSMSPSTINWLQALVPSTSSESLTSLISPATLYSAGSNSASGIEEVTELLSVIESSQTDDTTMTKSDGLTRTPSCEIIDWKAYNESCAENKPSGPVKWRVIPQHGPHAADLAISGTFGTNVGSKLPPSSGISAFGTSTAELSSQQQMYVAARKTADDKNKRKALVSPEYVQYGGSVAVAACAISPDPTSSIKIDSGSMQYATKVEEPSGRRPVKKSLHQATLRARVDVLKEQQQNCITPLPAPLPLDRNGDVVRCKCTGKCRNARCACVKLGVVCGTQCKCVSCANPFKPMAFEGINVQLVVQDICLMQHLSKIKDMQELLNSTVIYECCEGGGGAVQVKHTIERGFSCPHCGAKFTYSWCNNRLCPDAKKPRRHCAKCRRCGDHRNQHCNLCNHCYFAGVANSFRCSCHMAESGSGSKKRTVVPNSVPRDLDSIKAAENGTKNQVTHETTVNIAAEKSGFEKIDVSSGVKAGEEDFGDSCEIQ